MVKLVFLPVGLAAGLISGLLSKKLFQTLWRAIDREQPPRAEQRWISVPKLALSLALEGAVFRLVKGVVDHGSRRGFASLTGAWPGEEEPAAE